MTGSDEKKNTGDTGAVQPAWRLTGPDFFFLKKNAMSIQMGSKSDPRDLMFMDQPMTLVFSRLNSNPDPLGDDLDLQIVDRRPFEILPLGELTKLKNLLKEQKDCEGISACETVTIVRGIVSRAGQTSLGRLAPEQARSAGTQGSQTPRARRTCDKMKNSRSTSCSTMQRVEEAQKRLNH